MKNLICKITEARPKLFEDTGNSIWTDPHIRGEMLKAHLDPGSDAASRKPETVETLVAWIADVLKPGSRILDLGCGPGLYAERFADRGFRVTGVDINAASIAYARSRRSDIEYLEGDYLEHFPAGEYDAVIMIYCDMGTHSDAGRERLLANCHACLAPGGRLFFDVFDEAVAGERPEGRDWDYRRDGGFWSPGEYLLLRQDFHFREARVCAVQYHLLTAGDCRRFVVWERYFNPQEIARLLRRSGFSRTQVTPGFAGGNDFTSDSTLWVVAERED